MRVIDLAVIVCIMLEAFNALQNLPCWQKVSSPSVDVAVTMIQQWG